MSDKIIIYQTADGQASIDVKLENDTVWLTQSQLAELFQKDRTVITRHINNVFKEKELEEKSNVHFLHFANSDKPVKIYALDVIISVGYRVKSQRGTQFRIWANSVLKDYIVKGYAVNNKIATQKYAELKQLVDILGRTVKNQEVLTTDEAGALIGVISDYTMLENLDLLQFALNQLILFQDYQYKQHNHQLLLLNYEEVCL